MRQYGTKTDEQRLALLSEYLSSGMSMSRFQKEKGLSHSSISRWLRIFAVDDKPVQSSQVVVMDQNAAFVWVTFKRTTIQPYNPTTPQPHNLKG